MSPTTRSGSRQTAILSIATAMLMSAQASALIGAKPSAAYVQGASDPIHKGDVVLRDLDAAPLAAVGHTAIFLGAQSIGGPPMVVEALDFPLNPNSGERGASGHFINPVSVLFQQQSVQINPFHTQFNEKGDIVQLGFVRPRGDAPRRKDGTYEWLRYHGARFGLRVVNEAHLGWQWSTRQQLSQLADWAVRERSFGTEYDFSGIRTLYGYVGDRCVKFSRDLWNRITCLESVRLNASGRFRCDTLITAFWNCQHQCNGVGRSPNAWMGGGMRWLNVQLNPTGIIDVRGRTLRVQTPSKTWAAFQFPRPLTRPFEEGKP